MHIILILSNFVNTRGSWQIRAKIQQKAKRKCLLWRLFEFLTFKSLSYIMIIIDNEFLSFWIYINIIWKIFRNSRILTAWRISRAQEYCKKALRIQKTLDIRLGKRYFQRTYFLSVYASVKGKKLLGVRWRPQIMRLNRKRRQAGNFTKTDQGPFQKQ